MDSENSIVTQGTDVLGTMRGMFGDLMNYRILSQKIDAETARPMYFNDPAGGSYALGPGGQLYVRGANASVLGDANTAGMMQQLFVIALVIGGGVLAFRALS